MITSSLCNMICLLCNYVIPERNFKISFFRCVLLLFSSDESEGEEIEFAKYQLHNSLLLLRQCCSHPYIIERPIRNKEIVLDERLVTCSGKMIILDRLLAQLKKDGHKATKLNFFLKLCFWFFKNFSILHFSVLFYSQSDLPYSYMPSLDSLLYAKCIWWLNTWLAEN